MTTKISNNLIRDDFVLKPIYDSGIIDTAVTTIDITGLNLAPTESYNIVYTIRNVSGSAADYYLNVNGFNTLTDYYSQAMTADAGAVVGARENTSRIGSSSTASKISGQGSISLDYDNDYLVKVDTSRFAGSSSVNCINYSATKASSLAGNLTSLRLTTDISNAIGIGSRFRIYRTL